MKRGLFVLLFVLIVLGGLTWQASMNDFRRAAAKMVIEALHTFSRGDISSSLEYFADRNDQWIEVVSSYYAVGPIVSVRAPSEVTSEGRWFSKAVVLLVGTEHESGMNTAVFVKVVDTGGTPKIVEFAFQEARERAKILAP